MWPIGSSPDLDGAPPVLVNPLRDRGGTVALRPGPDDTVACSGPPRVSSHSTHSPDRDAVRVDGDGAGPLPGDC